MKTQITYKGYLNPRIKSANFITLDNKNSRKPSS